MTAAAPTGSLVFNLRFADWRTALSAASLGAAALLGTCGGGGGDLPPATATAVTYSQGVISGFGSVIIGGVRFDDTTAKVEDEDEDGAAHDRS